MMSVLMIVMDDDGGRYFMSKQEQAKSILVEDTKIEKIPKILQSGGIT